VQSLAYSAHGRYLLAAVGDRLRIWDSSSFQLRQECIGHQNTIVRIAVSATKQLAATVSHDSTARVWSLETGACLRVLAGGTARMTMAAFSPDDRVLATGDDRGVVRIWDLRTGQELLTLSELGGVVCDLFFTSELTLVAVGMNEHIEGLIVIGQWQASPIAGIGDALAD
jgi:WD40 repeat protein